MRSLIRMCSRVVLRLWDKTALSHYYFDDGKQPTLFVPGYVHLAGGTLVDLEIAFTREQVSFRARGNVRWKRIIGNQGLPAGISVQLLPAYRSLCDLLVEYAAGRSTHHNKRSTTRFPVTLEVEYSTATQRDRGLTADLSRDGASILGQRLPPVGSHLHVRMKSPAGMVNLVSEVRWCRADQQRVFGVRFAIDSHQSARRIQRLIDHVRQQMEREQSLSA